VTHVRGGLTQLSWAMTPLLCALTRLLGSLTHVAVLLTNRGRVRTQMPLVTGDAPDPRPQRHTSSLTHPRGCLTHPPSCLTQSPARLTTAHKTRAAPESPQATRGRLRARQHRDFSHSPWTRTATRSTRHRAPIDLSPRDVQVLAHLLSHPGKVISKNARLDTVWAEVFVTENNLEHAIGAMRKAIDDGAAAQRLIQTVKRKGWGAVCLGRRSV
jgi:hypothetical protein